MKKIISELLTKKQIIRCALILLATSYTPLIFNLGRKVESKSAALKLSKHFDLEINDLKTNKIKDYVSSQVESIKLEKIILAKATHINGIKIEELGDLYKNKIVYYIHKRYSNTDVRTIGSIITEKKIQNRSKVLNKTWKTIKDNVSEISTKSLMIEKAYAQNSFEWHGYENNYKYTEKYIDKDTVERKYNDGAILRYEMDNNGNSIPSSFRWIN